MTTRSQGLVLFKKIEAFIDIFLKVKEAPISLTDKTYFLIP